MKVTVYLADLNDALKARTESFIHDNWPHVAICSVNGNQPAKQENNDGATLTVASGSRSKPPPRTTLSETIIVNGETVEEVLYLVNAKLGRLTSSEIARSDRPASLKAPLSRREFLFGMLSRSSPAPDAQGDAPVVSAESCEARFGCRKCVDACPAPGALEVRENSLVVSKEHCIRCGLCAGICPVAAIQVPEIPENAYVGLLTALQNSHAPKKTLVITCNPEAVPKAPWVDVEHVPGIGVIGVRQLTMAASTSIDATIVYCPNGLCVGKEHVKRAVDLISSITNATPPSVYYLEGAEAAEIKHIHDSAQKREGAFEPAANPWKSYVTALDNISADDSLATGLGITDIQIAETCTLCNACVDKCPHRALGIEGGELIFDPRECTGCSYCHQICPENAITLLERDGSIEFLKRPVYKDEMVKCSKCNAPYASAKMIRKVSAALQIDQMIPVCPTCREAGMYDALFGKAPSKRAAH